MREASCETVGGSTKPGQLQFSPWVLLHLSVGQVLSLALIFVDVVVFGSLGLIALIMFSGILRVFLKRHFPEG
jgi:hypothetical protein